VRGGGATKRKHMNHVIFLNTANVVRIRFEDGELGIHWHIKLSKIIISPTESLSVSRQAIDP
jgi:hypothetical protein